MSMAMKRLVFDDEPVRDVEFIADGCIPTNGPLLLQPVVFVCHRVPICASSD
jgi:hypothetical protein